MILSRIAYDAKGIFGVLQNRENETICKTLEHAYEKADGLFRPKVPVGEFLCVRGIHTLKSGARIESFEVVGIYGHHGIIFHAGNTNEDSAGCILLGESASNGRLVNSRAAFLTFMSLLRGVESFTLTVI